MAMVGGYRERKRGRGPARGIGARCGLLGMGKNERGRQRDCLRHMVSRRGWWRRSPNLEGGKEENKREGERDPQGKGEAEGKEGWLRRSSTACGGSQLCAVVRSQQRRERERATG